MVVNRVIAVAEELAGSFQLLQGVRSEHDIDAELQIPTRMRNLPVDCFNRLHEIQSVSHGFSRLVGQLASSSARG